MSSSGARPAAAARRKPSARTIVAGVLGVLLVVFAILNSQTVTVHWIVGTSEVALIVVIALCGLVGFAVGWLLARRQASRRGAR
jgi:uncharacterized integral membrane protein